ncbi:DUF2254 domain-containing protein [Oricola sp.]|uniref:DUF2254 domain-containing protein n=1 Tax=Oricola sp. TaxID=1979950 RepID=UPI0025F694C4|nr:DUF2254 domain-containing protein [Oricola sp.]MCI5074859.1 DUF2254 domain-containing protein [Oricola sp.]
MFRNLQRQFISIQGLITVPGAIALVIWALSVPLLWLDHEYRPQIADALGMLHSLPPETASDVLSTIATAAITTLSLVYSLVLVVFTLAAGNIAPRLLKVFTSDRVNQVTAGLLGGAFLFALTVLYRVRPDFVPILSVAVAIMLAALFVLQLIYFVHSVSRSVTIDEEIASISSQLEERISTMVREDEEEASDPRPPLDFPYPVTNRQSGYLNAVDEEVLYQLACENDMTVQLQAKPGEFILEGQAIAKVSRMPDGKADEINKVIHEALLILPSRTTVGDIEYSINLLLEIALRALSPGVNDTFTAIASLDRMTAAFSAAVRHGLRSRDVSDEDAVVRVEIPGLSLKDMLNTAFHPLRQAASGNMLMMIHIADALARLHEIGNQKARTLISSHGELLLASCRASGPLDEDYAFLEQRLPFLKQGE